MVKNKVRPQTFCPSSFVVLVDSVIKIRIRINIMFTFPVEKPLKKKFNQVLKKPFIFAMRINGWFFNLNYLTKWFRVPVKLWSKRKKQLLNKSVFRATFTSFALESEFSKCWYNPLSDVKTGVIQYNLCQHSKSKEIL